MVYSVKCGWCEKEYIGKVARTLEVKFKEHMNGKHPNSVIIEHTSTIGHQYTMAYVKVLVKEDCDTPICLELVSCDCSGHVM